VVLTLPCLQITFPTLPPDLAREVSRAVAKFATGQPPWPISLDATLRCDDIGARDVARDLASAANVRFQFVSGVESAGGARYATADGSVVSVSHQSGELTLHLNRQVFSAPYSTWADLFAAPLAAAWRHHGYYPLHAAAVSADDAALLIVGSSGSGKTTMSLALVESGGTWRADDKVLLHADSGSILAASLYSNTNLAPATIAAHESLAFALDRPSINETNAKRPCSLSEVAAAVDLSPFRPTALIFPRQVPRRESRLRRLTDIEAVIHLSAQSPMSGERTRMGLQHRLLVEMARQLPAWEVEAGSDVLDRRDAFVARIREALSQPLPCPAS
jgi:hypothetical protein